MPSYFFKLLGGFGDRAEVDIDIDFDLSVAQVKDLVRKALRVVPNMGIELMVKGKKLSDGQKWGMTDASPNSTSPILVIGHRND